MRTDVHQLVYRTRFLILDLGGEYGLSGETSGYGLLESYGGGATSRLGLLAGVIPNCCSNRRSSVPSLLAIATSGNGITHLGLPLSSLSMYVSPRFSKNAQALRQRTHVVQ